MKKFALMMTMALMPVVTAPAAAQTYSEQRRWERAQQRFEEERRVYEREREIYMRSRDRVRDRDYGYDRGGYRDPYATDYDAARYYREDPRYTERRLGAQDEVYRGSDGRYYCKRSDGTTGLIIGGAGGAVLGNVIDGGGNRAAGTLIGGALGALMGRAIERNNDIRCR
jgi:hypothetical protein